MLVALPNAFGEAATNMAIDAALLESLPEGLAVFRHYGWTEPAVTFGYAQAYADVQKLVGNHLALVRRLTGGGIVDHGNDWTYALVIHTSLPTAQTPATELYERIHRTIAATLSALDLETQLAPCRKACGSPNPTSHATSQCFVAPAVNDVLRPDGRKIAGAAMKRNRSGLLIQGSLDRGALPEEFDFSTFQAKLVAAICLELDLPTGTLEDIRPLFQSARIQKEKHRFASDDWNRRR